MLILRIPIHLNMLYFQNGFVPESDSGAESDVVPYPVGLPSVTFICLSVCNMPSISNMQIGDIKVKILFSSAFFGEKRELLSCP